MLNIRMRASQQSKSSGARKRGGKYPKPDETHISGAEGIYNIKERARIVESYMTRALNHSRGRPDRIVITLERIRSRPRRIKSLPVMTLECGSPSGAKKIVRALLRGSGVAAAAVGKAFGVLEDEVVMRGACLILAGSGKRVEPDRQRGVRVSMLGISRAADKALSLQLTKFGLDTSTVKEAVVLASKVMASGQVVAELCISDDPGYTTGYVSSARYGYVRIPHMKKKGVSRGGRVFFLKEDADIGRVIGFLEDSPVIVGRTAVCRGTHSLDEILNNLDR